MYTRSIGEQIDIHADRMADRIDVSQKTSPSKGVSGLASDNPQRDNLDGISRSEDLCLKEKVI